MHFEQKAIMYKTPESSLYLGKLERCFKRANITPTLFVSLEDDVELLDSQGQPIAKSKSFLIPSGINVSIDTHNNNLAMFFLDDFGKKFLNLKPKMSQSVSNNNSPPIYFDSNMESEIIEHAQYIANTRPVDNEISELLTLCLNTKQATTHIQDERVAFAVALIKDHCHTNMSVAEIADKVNLSVPRLIQLFKQATGSPIRRFRLWHRIFATAEKAAAGTPLTEAAIACGFSDYAHFSRTYRELSGGNPSAARNNTAIRMLAS